jgi:NTE family protein
MSQLQKTSKGVGLALSGGGFRATLFHIGSLWRLNELGWLQKIEEITSVSGGSITGAFLGIRWKQLTFNNYGIATNFQEVIVSPLCKFCSKTLDIKAILCGMLLPLVHPSDLIIKSYKTNLFGDSTLQDLPMDKEGPRFTIYATSLQTGADVRFSRPYLAEYHIGLIESPKISIAQAVAASSAFPPVLCPVTIPLSASSWKRVEGAHLYENVDLRSTLILGDGGIYDNLGLERIWKNFETILVSDAGAPFSLKARPGLIRFSLVARTKRTLDIATEQTRALRKRRLVEEFNGNMKKGTYWGIGTQIDNYELELQGLPGPMTHDNDITRSMAQIRTRLDAFSDQEQGRLINWGYALTDAAMRRHVVTDSAKPGQWPIPEHKLST